MKTIKYVPKEARGEDAKFAGHVELRLCTFEEKLEYGDRIEVYLQDATTEQRKNILRLRILLEIAQEHYVDIQLTNVATGEVYATYEDLTTDSDCQAVLIEISTAVISGAKMGNA